MNKSLIEYVSKKKAFNIEKKEFQGIELQYVMIMKYASC